MLKDKNLLPYEIRTGPETKVTMSLSSVWVAVFGPPFLKPTYPKLLYGFSKGLSKPRILIKEFFFEVEKTV